MNWPWWFLILVLGVELWPVALGFGVGLLAIAVLARGRVRWAAIISALPCLAVTGVAAWWGIEARQRDRNTAAYEAATHQILDHDQVLNGLSLPAGTAVEWRDIDHSQLAMASLPNPIALFGLRVSWIRRSDDGQGWDLQLAEPVEGWTCATFGVHVSAAGRLRSCQLAAGRTWQGWSVPAAAFLDLTTVGKKTERRL